MKKIVLSRLIFPIIASLIVGFIFWLFSVQSRVTANEFEVKSVKETITEVKKDTSSILCILGERSECRK